MSGKARETNGAASLADRLGELSVEEQERRSSAMKAVEAAAEEALDEEEEEESQLADEQGETAESLLLQHIVRVTPLSRCG